MKTKPLTFLLSLTFLFLFSGSVYGQEEVKKEYWDNGKLKAQMHYKNGKKDGIEGGWYESGRKRLRIGWKNGKMEGAKIQWDEYGEKKIEFHQMAFPHICQIYCSLSYYSKL